MKAVMISIQPKWVEKIANGQKTIEVRKTRPKIDTPFKCYIYCTKGKQNMTIPLLGRVHNKLLWICNGKVKQTYGYEYMCQDDEYWCLNGKVIGEFVCDRIEEVHEYELTPSKIYYELEKERIDLFLKQSCLSYGEISEYRKNLPHFKPLYGWHISDLVIYDEPKELSEFYAEGDCDCMNCKKCAWFDSGNGYNVEDDCNLAYKGVDFHKSFKPILRPPQSWCYVEEKE